MPYTQISKPYVLPAASTSTLGGIKTDGTITTLDTNNVLQISKDDLLAGSGSHSINVRGGSITGAYSVVLGGGATGAYSVAIGNSSGAYDEESIAIGASAKANSYLINDELQWGGIAIGGGAKATNGGVQIGSGTNADHDAFCVGGASNYKLLDLTTGLIPSARIPGATVANAGKYLTINSSGEIVAADLPMYNGGVS